MSESAKSNNEIGPSCLHCRVHNSKQEYQEIFDEVGIEIELPDLLAKYFQLTVKPDSQKQQLLCQECVNTLIRFFDIDELQREQDAANAANAAQAKNNKVAKTVPNAARATVAKRQAKPEEKKKSPPAKIVQKKLSPIVKSAKAVIATKTTATATAAAAVATKPEETVAIRIVRSSPATAEPAKRLPLKAKVAATKTIKTRSVKENNAGEQEQISALIRDILNDEDTSADNKLLEAAETVRQLEAESAEEHEQEAVEEEQEVVEEPEHQGELEILLEHEDGSSGSEVRIFKGEKRSSRNSSQSPFNSEEEDETLKVEPFNFVFIKESDDIDDLYEYLATVIKTSFETLTFDWATVCGHCSLKCNKYETLLSHMLRRHELPEERYKCPIKGCTVELQGRKSLAMHLVVLHAPVADIPIYGSCPECYMTFSNILHYNKHSCAHVIKKRRGARLYCEMCNLDFPSWKRFNFHNQFHLERHRPRACFVCSYADTNIDDLFQHLHYAHEPEGTLFCDICDRNFRDAVVFMEHNKSHTNVSSTTFSCPECNANFETRGRLTGHIRSTHATVISCELCAREFATEATYNIHMKKHLIIERDVHVCNNCGQLSESSEKMMAHVENEKSVCFGVSVQEELLRNAYVCEYCSAYFKTKEDLRAHRDSGAHKDGNFWCEPCQKQFTDMKLYRHHLRNYQQLRSDIAHRRLEICLFFMCDYEDCSDSYLNWNSLYTHKRRTHDSTEKLESKPKENEWVCQFCSKVCRSKMSLSVHVARSHNNNNVSCSICKSSYKNAEALEKHHAYWHEPMECSLCFKVVKNRRNYDTHMNVVHSNNKRYSCSVCQKGFYHKSEMEAHQRLHTQSYNCDKCSFTTRNKKSLSVHVMGQHYKRFAFECKICKKSFGRRQGLSNHTKRVHDCKLTCQDFYHGGCNKRFSQTAQLNMHVRIAHNGSIFLNETKIDEELISDDDAPTTSKKRSRPSDDIEQIEFLEQEAEELDNELSDEIAEIYEDIKQIKKVLPQRAKRQRKR